MSVAHPLRRADQRHVQRPSAGNGGVLYAGVDGALPIVDGAVTLPTLSTTARLHLRYQTAQSPDGWTLAHVRQYLSSAIGSLCVLDIPADAAASASSVRTAARAA